MVYTNYLILFLRLYLDSAASKPNLSPTLSYLYLWYQEPQSHSAELNAWQKGYSECFDLTLSQYNYFAGKGQNWNIFSIYTDKVSQLEYIKEFAGAKLDFLVTAPLDTEVTELN